MADIQDPNAQNSPGADDALTGTGNGDTRGIKRPRVSAAADDDDDDDDKPGRERRKIDIKFIQDKSRRHITFSKRKAGIMKKVSEIHSTCIHRSQCPTDSGRPTNCRCSQELKSYFWWSRKLVWCTPSRPQSFSRLLRKQRAKT